MLLQSLKLLKLIFPTNILCNRR